MIIWFIIAGAVSGVVAGMGMGGGTLLIPILTLLLDVPQKLSQSINLIVFIPTAVVALIIHYKNKLVNTKVGVTIIISGVIFSVLGAWLASTLSNNELKIYFGIFLIFIGVFQFVDSLHSVLSKDKLPQNLLVRSKLNIFSMQNNKYSKM
ncbi:MAG: sulfite exporter TauE/SafE family protein [Clostridiales bacterium]|nr:sulfite exporter TauE/SafE family protein [Clostridiales bacterium]